jgi:hypothetical protein
MILVRLRWKLGGLLRIALWIAVASKIELKKILIAPCLLCKAPKRSG